ncbi:MAG TPA: hypothetical protein VFW78_00685, partial [Bacteroidia bacterium]|nr:hypothetical protein [Bacteroidia bacterium]
MQPKKLCFLVSAFICLMTATAFAGQADYSILFKTGTLIPESNLEDFITAPQPASDQQFDGKYFRLIQFNAIPTAAQKVELANAGFRLISYFPNFAFWTEIRANASKEILRNYAVRSVIDVNPINKLDREIAAGNFPSYAMHGKNEIDLQIGYYKGLNSEMVQSAFTHSGFEIVQRYDYSSWMVVRVPVTKIGDITAMPFVASVTAVAPPSEPDDEQARSLHRSSTINRTDAPIGRHYSGAGVSAALGDDGPVGPHIDYQGRIDQSNTTANVGNHGDMTVGILMGAGNIDPTIKGMATGAFIYVYDIGGYAHVLNSPSLNANQGVMVTSTSYSQGCNDYTTDTQTGD